MVDLEGGAFSYERGTPAPPAESAMIHAIGSLDFHATHSIFAFILSVESLKTRTRFCRRIVPGEREIPTVENNLREITRHPQSNNVRTDVDSQGLHSSPLA